MKAIRTSIISIFLCLAAFGLGGSVAQSITSEYSGKQEIILGAHDEQFDEALIISPTQLPAAGDQLTSPAPSSTDYSCSSTSQEDQQTTLAEDNKNHEAAIKWRVFNDPHFLGNRSVIVHLHEWTYRDIAQECEDFLGPNGFAGVQTSPASENVVIPSRPWYERYQPISYQIATRSGNAIEFFEMTQRCRAVGIRIYVDVVPNHMTSNLEKAIGTGGSAADPQNFFYPAVPYTAKDFHNPPCQIDNYDDPWQARVCEMVGLHDLNQTVPRVQWAIINFLDRLIYLGAAGFRVDASKHMFPKDLEQIYSRISRLPKNLGFDENSDPFIYQEVGDGWKFNYTHLGAVTEFAHPTNMAKFFKNQSRAADLKNYGGPLMGMLDSENALVFVDNHDLQRQNPFTLSFKNPREFRAANAFTLAHPYGIVRVMSSFNFKNDQQGPPHDSKYNIKRPRFDIHGQSISGWVAEHRWPAIANMVKFRNVVGDRPLTSWWDDGDSVLAFCRGDRGFIIISAGTYDFRRTIYACLQPGIYCNAMAQRSIRGVCPKKSRVFVDQNRTIHVDLPRNGAELALALHIGDLIQSL